MQDDQTASTDEQPYVDRSMTIAVGPGGISFVIVTGMICLTVWFVLLGMGKIDLTQFDGSHKPVPVVTQPAHENNGPR